MANKVESRYLKNDFEQGAEAYKLLPTQADREPFFAAIDGKGAAKDCQIGRAFDYFAKRVRPLSDALLERLFGVVARNLVLVSIVLDKDDNPYLIFESLNAKGRPLSQADLIRNYFFMRIHVGAQDQVFDHYWKPMQERLGDALTEYIRHYLMGAGKPVRQSDIYFTLKEGIEEKSGDEVVTYLQGVAAYSVYYARLLEPAQEPVPELAVRLARLNRFEATTAYPFLLDVYHAFANDILAEAQFVQILDTLETFLIRRYICNVPSDRLSRIFTGLYARATASPSIVEGVTAALARQEFPTDREFRDRLVTFKLYGGGDRLPKARLILERLEESFGHKEKIDFDQLTIEHVMPQTPTDWWQETLGDGWEAIHATWLDTIGNLTLTGYNPELSNSDFPTKQAILRKSHLELNRYFDRVQGWDEQAIASRGEYLAERAAQVWADFAPAGSRAERPEVGEDAVQKDVSFLMTEVIRRLGGEVERLGAGARRISRVGDGSVVNVKHSKWHGHYYWFGIPTSLWQEIGKAGGTHVVFVLVPEGFVKVPVGIIQDYLTEANTSPNPDGTVRHYHIFISKGPKPELFHHGNPVRIPLSPYFSRFEG